jgi:hypothetical protein
VEFAAGSGIQVVDLRDALRKTEVFAAAGAALLEVEPRLVRVEVEQLVPVDVPVRVELQGAAVEGEPRADPETVRYELPASLAANVDELFVTARLTEPELAGLPAGTAVRVPGVRAVPSAALASAWGKPVATRPVDLHFTLRSRLSSMVLATVPVHVRAAPAELQRFDVLIDDSSAFIADVTLRGPAALIERITLDASLRPVAEVALSFEELELGIDSKAAVLRMPPGFEAVEARAENLLVGLSVVRRERPVDDLPDPNG